MAKAVARGPVKRFPEGDLAHLLDEALEVATWLTDADKPTIQLARNLAVRLDRPDFPYVTYDGENWSLDNVSESLFLRTLEKLGLMPSGRAGLVPKEADSGAAKLGRLQARVRETTKPAPEKPSK